MCLNAKVYLLARLTGAWSTVTQTPFTRRCKETTLTGRTGETFPCSVRAERLAVTTAVIFGATVTATAREAPPYNVVVW